MRALAVGMSVLALSAALVACGEAGSSNNSATSGTASGGAQSGGACTSAKSDELVVLQDDKKLQTVDNIIPAVYKGASTPALLAALDKVSAALTTDKLIQLNKSVDIDRQTADKVADSFVSENSLTSGVSGGSGDLQIGAGNFGESKILANIYAKVLTAAGFTAQVKEVGNRELYLKSLSTGEIDVYAEYAGTLTEFLNKQQNGANAEAKASGDLDATVTALTALGEKANLVFGKPSQAADQNAFAVTKAYADANGITTLSDLAAKCGGGQILLGGPPECPQRVFCEPGLEKTYGLKFSGFKPLDAGGPLTKQALKTGAIQLGLVFSSDGSLAG